MRLRDILAHKGHEVVSVEPDARLMEAIATLNQRKIGALIVRTNDQVVGIVTERDVLHACHDRFHDFSELRVRDLMTRDLVIAHPDDTSSYAMSVMTQCRIRHLPLFEDGELLGVVSIGDLVNAELEEADVDIRMMRDYVSGYCAWPRTG